MHEEYVFVLNDREKQMAKKLILELAAEKFPAKRLTDKTNDLRHEISYEYRSTKQEKTVHGSILNCPYKLRYRDGNRIFFSAWDCKDVCGVFYDVLATVYAMNQAEPVFAHTHDPFVQDLHPERYVFCTGQSAVSLAKMADFLHDSKGKVSHSSQYVFSLFEEPDKGEYGGLIETLKTSGYSTIRILQIWIRGEILYYATADGVVLRSEHQRTWTPKEDADIIRKIYKAVNERFRFVDLTRPDIFSADK
jgi:hypothetical protein